MASDMECRYNSLWTTSLYELFPVIDLANTKIQYKQTNNDADNTIINKIE